MNRITYLAPGGLVSGYQAFKIRELIIGLIGMKFAENICDSAKEYYTVNLNIERSTMYFST